MGGNKHCPKGWNEQLVTDKGGKQYAVCTKGTNVPIVEPLG